MPVVRRTALSFRNLFTPAVRADERERSESHCRINVAVSKYKINSHVIRMNNNISGPNTDKAS